MWSRRGRKQGSTIGRRQPRARRTPEARANCFVSRLERYLFGIAEPEKQIQALIRLEVACQVALEALPELPDDTEQALRDHVQTLCDVTGAELDQINPGWRDASGDS